MRYRIQKLAVCFGMGVLLACGVTAGAADLMDGYVRTSDGQGNYVIDFAEVQVTLPESWQGKYGIHLTESSAMFYHISSMKAANLEGYTSAGHMFTINFSENYDFMSYYPSYSIVGGTEEGVYYLTFPTDVQGFGDEESLQEWRELCDDMDFVKEHIVLTKGQSDGAADTGEDAGEPVKAAVQLYEGDYRESAVFWDGVLEEYYTLSISEVTDTSFEFTIWKVNGATGDAQTVFMPNTAYFENGGKTAAFYGQEYTLKFYFPDDHNALPAVTDIVVTGFAPVEGKTMVNNGVPGHEFS